jgi:hypothetical protein
MAAGFAATESTCMLWCSLPAVDHADRLADEGERDGDVNLLIQIDPQEVDVHQGLRDRVDLRILDHRRDLLGRGAAGQVSVNTVLRRLSLSRSLHEQPGVEATRRREPRAGRRARPGTLPAARTLWAPPLPRWCLTSTLTFAKFKPVSMSISFSVVRIDCGCERYLSI